jgi:hypothetical protein
VTGHKNTLLIQEAAESINHAQEVAQAEVDEPPRIHCGKRETLPIWPPFHCGQLPRTFAIQQSYFAVRFMFHLLRIQKSP